MSDEKIKVPRGLAGVIADTSEVSKVNVETNSLIYRGYRVQDLANNCQFEEVAYLLVYGELPTKSQLDDFTKTEKSYREISQQTLNVIENFPKNAHPMDALRTAVSFIGMEDDRIWDHSFETNIDKYLNLLAKIPTAIAAYYRHISGREFIHPKKDLSMSENFFHMCFGEIPAAEVIKAFDASLTLYAEHSFNASTFTTRVITSTTSDLYSAIVGGIGALKGPLHGGANEQVMHTLKEIGSVEQVDSWLEEALAQKKKIMGFGHRVYRKGDSRVPTMKSYTEKMADFTGERKWLDIANKLEEKMIEEKGIHPNLDFPAGPAYYMMGFEIEMFTPIFVMARVAGWTAHVLEQTANNRIIRPLSEYVGHAERDFVALENR